VKGGRGKRTGERERKRGIPAWEEGLLGTDWEGIWEKYSIKSPFLARFMGLACISIFGIAN
jgi:hypothetical protein